MAEPTEDMILPKGIVVNSQDIYAEIAALPVLDNEQIGKCWAVYTTTNRRLIDPTAQRLENFWWHVWGSDRRHLSGRALAKIFEEISSGPTFVPLRGPANRWEGPPRPQPRHSQHESDRTSQASRPATQKPEPRENRQQEDRKGKSRIKTSRQEETRSQEQPREIPQKPAMSNISQSSNNLTPSSSRPPPSHPILKKPRGPSNSGPRPTARFVSPHGSEGEGDGKADEDVPSGGLTMKKPEVRSSTKSTSPAKTDKKPAASKKFVASTTASKRRPALPRRPSSQSSTSSTTDVGSREGSSTGSKYIGPPRPIPKISEQSGKSATPKSEEGSSSSATINEEEEEEPPLSAKAAGKRPAVDPKAETKPEKQAAAKGSQASGGQIRPPVALPSKPAAVPQNRPSEDTRLKATENAADTSRKGEDRGTVTPLRKASSEIAAPSMVRSRSNNDSFRMPSGHQGAARALAAPSVATSTVAVSGTFGFDVPHYQPAQDTDALPSRSTNERDMASPSILDSRFTPTPSNPSPAPPLGRSKSQLTFLMERDKARRA